MPWTVKDVDGFRKGLNGKQKGKWINIANSVLKKCMEGGGSEEKCSSKAVRIANSNFGNALNPVITIEIANKIKEMGLAKKKEEKKMRDKIFQYTKFTPPDPRDGHTHKAAFDENGDGATDVAGKDYPHSHNIWSFRVQPYGYFDGAEDEQYISSHPGSLAFNEKDMTPEMKAKMKKCIEEGGAHSDCIDKIMNDSQKMGEIEEMEIFRAGTHNGDDFTEEDLEEIALNFSKLKDEVRPKLKITHHDHQKTLAGLASYGDIVEVYTKHEAGEKKLYAKIKNVPKEVIELIKNRRFPERSIEIYPEFRLGTKDGSPVYKNVLKAIALLGQEMPAVTGMAPIKLSEFAEQQKTICFQDVCLCEEAAEKHLASLLAQTGIKCLEAKISIERSKSNA